MKPSNNSINTEQENNIEILDLKKILYKVFSNWYWFVLSSFIALSLAFFVNRYTDPTYNIKSSILVRDKTNSNSSGVDNILQEMNFFNRFRRKNVENEKGILESYYLTYKTITKLDFGVSYFGIGRIRQPEIYKASPFIVVLDSTLENKYDHPIYISIINDNEYQLTINGNKEIKSKLKFGEAFHSDDFNFTIHKNKLIEDKEINTQNEYYFVVNNLNNVAKTYRQKLNISINDEKSSILTLSSNGKVVEKEVDFLNELCDTYIQLELDEKNEINEKTIKFIDEQLNIITDSLSAAEENLQTFREKNRTLNLSAEGGLLFEKLENLQKQLSTLIINDNYYKYLRKYIEDKTADDIISPNTMGINDPSLSKLILELNQLASDKNKLKMSSPNGNPALLGVNDEIENLKTLIKENLNTIINTNNLSINEVKQHIKRVDREIRKLPTREKQLISIKRKYTLNDEIYNFLLKKRAESGIAKASNTAENKILDRPLSENATIVSPKKKLNYIIAFLIALIIPLSIIIIIDFFDNKIHERKDIESRTQIPIIAEIGYNNKNSDLVVAKYPRSSISESFRKLRTSLKFIVLDNDNKSTVIAITSTISGEGKSFTSINTASVMAALNKKTIILGLDLRKPSLHKYFNIENDIGISEYLSNQTEYNSIIKKSDIPNLSYILAGTIPPNPAELIESHKMGELINKLKIEYDYIILDTPPLALVTDALLLNSFIDIQLHVVRQNYTNISTIDFINSIKENHNLKLNIVLNDINLKGYYSYKYNYNYKYGGGYYTHNYYEEDIKIPFAMKLIEKIIRK